jgi:glucosyl-3-phosphoglycerate synthase
MSDFHQHGPVTALPRLKQRPIEELEAAARALIPRYPVSLVLPMVPSEMDRPALARIRDELSRVDYLDSLVVSLNRANRADYRRAQEFFKPYGRRCMILWSESRAIQSFLKDLEDRGLRIGTPGKGRACWLALGYLLAEDRADYIAFQDADVVNFNREMLARLVLPALDPVVDYDFVKAYYARVSDQLNGRVTRLLLAPLLAAFVRHIGQHPYVQYLASFRYPLSGEFAVQRDLASRMRLPSDWGLEIVTLFEVLRHRAPTRVCQVEIAESYDHKHQDVSAGNPELGLHRMARDVVKHLLRTFAAEGVSLPTGLLRSLLVAYQREAEDAIADSYAMAWLNGLKFDRHLEEEIVQTFVTAVRTSIAEFIADPLGTPLVPNWARVWSGMPDSGARLLDSVASIRGAES